MWNRADLKYNAKSVLKRNFGMAFAAVMIMILIGLIPDVVKGLLNPVQLDPYGDPEMIWSQITAQSAKGYPIAMLFSFLVIAPLTIGYLRFFISLRDEEGVGFTTLFFGFSDVKYYLNAVKTQFFVTLYVLLWTLLLIIPGIIKRYQYHFVLYIIGDNPEIGTKRAFELSKAMTDGHKFKIFVLQLSFIGWLILSTVLCCLPFIYVLPYMEVTFAELYHSRKEDIIASGFATEQEFAL